MTIENPPIFEHGFVVGRYVTAVADTLNDWDRYPDLLAIKGRVRFTPLQTVHLKGGEHPATVVKQPIIAHLNAGGYVADVESMDGRIQPAVQQKPRDLSGVDIDPDESVTFIEGDDDPTLRVGLYLAAGLYRVEPIFDNVSSISRFTIEVTAEHTKDAPLDLTLAAPLETPPGFTEVVRIADRVRAEEAAEAAEGHTALALVYRDAAQASAQSAESDAGDAAQSATTAESHADRAEEARDETLSNAIEVDTSAGTKVTVGGHVVFYDSGWRDVSEYLVEGLDPSSGTGRARMRRVNNTVEFDLKVSVTEDGVTSIFTGVPSSFRPIGAYPMSNSIFTANTTSAGASILTAGTHSGVFYNTSEPIQTGQNTPWPNPGTVAWTDSYSTDHPFPTSLPGTPA